MAKETPFMIAVLRNRVEAVKFLAEKGADINKPSQGKVTPLHVATTSADLSLAHLLVDLGADVEAEDKRGVTPKFMLSLDRSSGDFKSSTFRKFSETRVASKEDKEELKKKKIMEQGEG